MIVREAIVAKDGRKCLLGNALLVRARKSLNRPAEPSEQ